MKGNNEVYLNQATMIEALQHYFDTILFKSSPKVIKVTWDGGANSFRVAVEETDEQKLTKGMANVIPR